MASASIHHNLDPAAFIALLKGSNGAANRKVQTDTNKVLNLARRNCPVDKGPLRASLTGEISAVGDVLIGRVGSNLSYAIHVHEGTGIYAGRGRIYPKNGRFLAWKTKVRYAAATAGGTRVTGTAGRKRTGGDWVFAKSIAGMKGRPFLTDALREVMGS